MLACSDAEASLADIGRQKLFLSSLCAACGVLMLAAGTSIEVLATYLAAGVARADLSSSPSRLSSVAVEALQGPPTLQKAALAWR